jgi:hypothetical protein
MDQKSKEKGSRRKGQAPAGRNLVGLIWAKGCGNE